jgi:Short C-terminal domain
VTGVNPVGWFIVVFFLVGGIIFWVTIPGIGIGQIWTAVAAFLALLYFGINRRGQKVKQLRQTGTPGTATILEMTQTGVYINENPQVKLKMRIEATGIPPYELEKRVTVPMIALGVLGSGRPLTVHIDANDHNNVAIDWSPTAGAAGMAGTAPPQVATATPGPATASSGDHGEEHSGVERLMDLQQMRDKGLITEKEFEENKARILKSL